MMLHLKLDYTTLLRWLNDICIQAVYQLSPEHLYNDRLFKSVLLLTFTDNNAIWKNSQLQINQATVLPTKAGEAIYCTKNYKMNTTESAET